MSETMQIWPVEGRLVLHPTTRQPVPAEGMMVPRNGYWMRRLADGDVTTTPPVNGEYSRQ